MHLDSRIIKNRYFIFASEIFLSVLPGLIYIYLNKSIRNNFPEETFLLNSWNLFTSLFSFFENPLGYNRSLTSFASIPEVVFSPFFNVEKPFLLLTFIVIFRLLILAVLSSLLFRIINATFVFRIIIFNFTFFNITTLWSLLVSPRFYSLILLYIMLNIFLRINEISRKKAFLFALLTALFTIGTLSNVANLMSTFIIFIIIVALLISFDIKILKNLRNANLYFFILTILSIYALGVFYVIRTTRFFSEIVSNHDFGFIPLSGNPLLSLIGSGHWSEFAGSGGIPYCSFCPLQNEFLLFRIAIVITLILLSLIIIGLKYNLKVMLLSAAVVILLSFISALGRSDLIFSYFIKEYTVLRIFREPWSKISYFIPLILAIIFSYAQIRIKQLSSRQYNSLTYSVPVLIFLVYLYVIFEGYVIPTAYAYSLFIWTLLALVFLYLKRFSIIILSIPVLFWIGTFSAYSSISANDQLKLNIENEYAQTVRAFRFFDTNYKNAYESNLKKCFIVNSYNRESMINYFASAISPINQRLIVTDEKNSSSIYVSRDKNDCIKNSVNYDQIYFPASFVNNDFFGSTFFKKFCKPLISQNYYYFAELNCNRVNLLNYRSNDSKFVTFTDPNNTGIGLVSSDVIYVNSSHATVYLNPEISIRSWNPFIKLDIEVNSLFLQLGEVNMDLYVENLRVGTISISDNSKYVSLEIPFGAFQDGTIQKIDFITALNPNQQTLVDKINNDVKLGVSRLNSDLFFVAINTMLIED